MWDSGDFATKKIAYVNLGIGNPIFTDLVQISISAFIKSIPFNYNSNFLWLNCAMRANKYTLKFIKNWYSIKTKLVPKFNREIWEKNTRNNESVIFDHPTPTPLWGVPTFLLYGKPEGQRPLFKGL